jgi:transposase
MKIAKYNSDLTDAQWEALQPLLPSPSKRGRPPTDRRLIIDALLYIAKAGSNGVCCHTTFPLGKRSIISFASGLAIILGKP